MKGIILAGGEGTRLYPVTKGINKHLLPIYDKPMIYYPLSILMLAGIREILIISSEKYLSNYKELLGDGGRLGLNLQYAIQDKPRGLADAFLIGEKFIGQDNVCLILGDNIFYGANLVESLRKAKKRKSGATVFGYYVNNPKEFGVVEFDLNKKIISIEEKPKKPKSNFIVPGLYFYDNNVIKVAKNIKPSARGELEITSINNQYLKKGLLNVVILSRGTAWMDAGTTHEGLLDASNFIEAIQKRQGLYIACIEEIAYEMGFISKKELIKLAQPLLKTDYGKYLIRISERK